MNVLHMVCRCFVLLPHDVPTDCMFIILPFPLACAQVEVAIKKLIAKQPVKNQSALANPECLDFYANVPELQ